ncbi:hypothetical protein EMEDMD4_530202 [Sinorhizobium medicae]|uniref:Uncharacterized protein n=1 Tax=Sinorhizobium medicae TaxID=110321 RepID=A0A508X869_9HYPH|nr:hypothetical protein EMEDMD4_530202 [Sinorhizobium medicae]
MLAKHHRERIGVAIGTGAYIRKMLHEPAPLKSGCEAMQEGHFHQNCQPLDLPARDRAPVNRAAMARHDQAYARGGR